MTFLAGSGVPFENEWHPTRNGSITPDTVTLGSNRLVWWLGECGHEWEMSVSYRNKGYNCPTCNSLGFLYPEIAKEWHPTRNTKTSFDYRANSGKKVWWVCDRGHEWDMVIRNRVRDKQNCPICVNQRVQVGFNDLATTHPQLAKEWHPTRNDPLSPENVTYGSKRSVWWYREECGHEWFASIQPRASKNIGCSVCRGLQVQLGVNDLATTHPEIAAEWHPTLNQDLNLKKIVAGSHINVWWLGKNCGHEWKMTVGARTGSNQGCPICSNHKIIKGLNDFQTTHPSIAKEWHQELNFDKLPDTLSFGSNFKATWICAKKHIWEAKVADRCIKQSTCPQCAATTYVSKAEKELADYVANLGLNVSTSVRNIIPGELDILIPSRGVAIEFNGLYWHSEANGKGKTYHYDKWRACKDKGIQLIQVWEDDWNRNPELVKRMLAHKLGVSSEPKVYARNTVVQESGKTVTDEFLNEYHIQGSVNGGIRLGLYNKKGAGELIVVMVLKTEPGSNGKTLNLLRYATSKPVPGGFSKLLKFVERTYTPESIITFSDNTVSDGGLYRNNGFMPVKELKPDYMYVFQGQRKHKFGYRLKRFRNDPALQYVEGLTEKELAQLNGLPRVWDAGKTKWVKSLKV